MQVRLLSCEDKIVVGSVEVKPRKHIIVIVKPDRDSSFFMLNGRFFNSFSKGHMINKEGSSLVLQPPNGKSS